MNLGHITRMSSERVIKKVLEHSVGGRRKKGRPKRSWKDIFRYEKKIYDLNWKINNFPSPKKCN